MLVAPRIELAPSLEIVATLSPERKYSFSQTDTFNKCQRLWAITKLEGTRTPPSKSQAVGTAIHADLEHYGNTAEIRSPFVQEAVIQGFVPTPIELPSGGWRTEYPFDVEIDKLIRFVGFVDVLDLRGKIKEIIDYKSTSDFKYVKTEEEISDNQQLLTYGRIFEPEEVKLSHIYFLTRGKPRVKKVSATASGPKVAAAWNATVATIDEMERLRADYTTADAVPGTGADTGHCGAYGGCAFRKRCGLPSNPLSQITRRYSMDPAKPNPLLEKLKKMTAPAEPAAPAAPAPSNVVPITSSPPPIALLAPDAGPRDGLAEPAPVEAPKRKAGRPPGAKNKPKEAPANPTPGIPTAGERSAASPSRIPGMYYELPGGGKVQAWLFADGTFRPNMDEATNVKCAGITPTYLTEALRPADPAVVKAAQVAQAEASPDPEQLPASDYDLAVATVGLGAQALEAAADTIEAHEAQIASYVDALDAANLKIAALETAIEAAHAERAPVEAPVRGFTLYIDCWPMKGDDMVECFDDWAAPALAEAAKIGEVPDAGLIDYQSKGVVAACLRELPLPDSLAISSKSRWYDVAREILIPKSVRRFKGSW